MMESDNLDGEERGNGRIEGGEGKRMLVHRDDLRMLEKRGVDRGKGREG